MATPSYEILYEAQCRKNPALRFEGTLVALDPGETTGVAVFKDGKLADSYQAKTWPIQECVKSISTILDVHKPKACVFESYQVYEWKSDDHKWSQIPTIQVIGSIQTLCLLREVPWHTQTAQVAKQFVTDQRLKDWGLWVTGARHARDATRHGCYFHLFGPKNSS